MSSAERSSPIFPKTSPTKLASLTGAVIGLCIVGDSLMYTILPLEAENLGFDLWMVGLLLSANRLIRLGSNSIASAVFERWGEANPFIFSAILGLLSTALYGINAGFIVFLLARILWGIAWSGLRQGGYQALWSAPDLSKGRLTGLLWGLIRAGSAFAAFMGGFFYDRFGYGATIALMVGVTGLALPLVLSIRWPVEANGAATKSQKGRASSGPERAAKVHPSESLSSSTAVQGWYQNFVGKYLREWRATLVKPSDKRLVAAGFCTLLHSSIVIATTALFIQKHLISGSDGGESTIAGGIGVGTAAGTVLAVRWISGLFIGPALGFVSDKIGQPMTALLLSFIQLVAIAAAVVLPASGALIGLLIVMIANGGLFVVLNAAVSVVAPKTAYPHRFVGIFTTANDFGSAIGPLLALPLAGVLGIPLIYMSIGLLLQLVVGAYWLASR